MKLEDIEHSTIEIVDPQSAFKQEVDQPLLGGRYCIQERVGQGTLGDVYLAADLNYPDLSVAIKLHHNKALLEDVEQTLKQEEKELELTKQLSEWFKDYIGKLAQLGQQRCESLLQSQPLEELIDSLRQGQRLQEKSVFFNDFQGLSANLSCLSVIKPLEACHSIGQHSNHFIDDYYGMPVPVPDSIAETFAETFIKGFLVSVRYIDPSLQYFFEALILEKKRRIAKLNQLLSFIRSLLFSIRRRIIQVITCRSVLIPPRRDEVFRKKKFAPTFLRDFTHALGRVQSELISARGLL